MRQHIIQSTICSLYEIVGGQRIWLRDLRWAYSQNISRSKDSQLGLDCFLDLLMDLEHLREVGAGWESLLVALPSCD